MTQLNIEAAKAIARELRLRNVGGIVVIDFVDLSTARARAQVLAALTEAMAPDRAKHQIYPMSPLGLVQLTRRRVRPALREMATRPCPYCAGNGVVHTPQTMAERVLAAVYTALGETACSQVLINAHPEVAQVLCDEAAPALATLEAAMQTQVLVVGRQGQHMERFELLELDRPGSIQAFDLRLG